MNILFPLMWRTQSGNLSDNWRYTQYGRSCADIDTKGSCDLILNWKKHRVSSAEPECESVNHTNETLNFSISISLWDLAIAPVHIAVRQLHQLKHLCGTIVQLPFLQFPIPGPNIDRLRSGRSGTYVYLELGASGEWGGGGGGGSGCWSVTNDAVAVLNDAWFVMPAGLFVRE